MSNCLAVLAPIPILLSTIVSSGIIIFGSGYENCREFGRMCASVCCI